MKRTYSLIIVTWNGRDLLNTYLPGVFSSMPAGSEVLIADNASTDGTGEWLSTFCAANGIPCSTRLYGDGDGDTQYKVAASPLIAGQTPLRCTHVRFPDNLGYAEGNNRAAAFASGDILLFLNNDVRVKSGWIEALDPVFDDPLVAVSQPKLLSDRTEGQFDYAGGSGGFMDRMGYAYARGRLFSTIEVDEGQYDDPIDIFWASGAAFAIRAPVFRSLGGFPEDFRFHMEEIDLCWRVWNRGFKVRAQPASCVYHLGGASLSASDPRKTFFNFRNSLLMMTRNLDTPLWPLRILLRLILDGIAAIPFALTGGLGHVLAILRAHWSYYRLLPTVIQQRSHLSGERTNPRDPEQMKPVSILIAYHLRGIRRFQDL